MCEGDIIMKRNTLIYPIKREYVSLFRYKELLLDDSAIIPVCVQGSRYSGVDIGELDKGEKLNIVVEDSFETTLQQCSECIFTEYEDDILGKIDAAIKCKKDIICLFQFPSLEIEQNIIEKCKGENVTYKNYATIQPNIDLNISNNLAEISVPVIVICGMSKETQKFDLQLAIRKRFLELGYKVTQVGTRKYSELFGMHNFPSYLLETNREIDKIKYFNKYIKELEMLEEPEIIIVGIPDGMIPYDSEHPNGFGILGHYISNAISVDCSVISLAFNEYDKEFFDFIKEYMKYKFNFEPLYCHLSNIYHDIQEDERFEDERLVIMGRKTLRSRIDEWHDKEISSVADISSINKLVDDIVGYLSH